MKPFLFSFSPLVLLQKAVVEGAKKVRSEGFHMIPFSIGYLWWRFMGLYQRLAQGASLWTTHIHFCYDQTELKPGLWPFCTVLVLKPGVFLLVYQNSKWGVLRSVSARLKEVLEPSLPQEGPVLRGSPLMQIILSWHHLSSSLVVTRDYRGQWQVERVFTGLRVQHVVQGDGC